MLEIQDLSVAYGRHTAIQPLNAGPLAPGRLVAVLGPNGSGKSTLLKAVAGLLACNGQVLLNNLNLTKLSFEQRAHQVVYLPQSLPARQCLGQCCPFARSGWRCPSGTAECPRAW